MSLPVEAVLDDLSRALGGHGSALLCAPPGSGKTTRVPLALLDAPWLQGRRIVMLEPRRVAARAAARFMAASLGEPVGERVGFRVRFESAVSPRTRVEVVTEGVLARRLQREPELPGVGLVIFDEFHERSLQADLALALALDVRRALRPDLRLLVMSATLDAEPAARLLGAAPVLRAGGRPHPVEVRHLAGGGGEAALERAVRAALAECGGDVLVFLPGAREIRSLEHRLSHRVDAVVCPLHGALPAASQDQAIRPDPQGRRRVVLATNIAESSLTIEGVRAVVDSGLARRPRFHPGSGLARLETVAISRASAEQRAGRAGRLGPGLALRLWSESEHAARAPHEPPEILEADLAGLVLEVAAWGLADPAGLDWLDPPPPGAWAQASDLLRLLGAIDARGHVTAAGRAMAALPVHPRIAAMLHAAHDEAARTLAADLGALLDAPDLPAPQVMGCDLAERARLLARHRGDGGSGGRELARIERVARTLRRAAPRRARAVSTRPEHAGALLLHGFPDRLAKRRSVGRGRFVLAGGREVRVAEQDPLAAADWLVVPDLDAGEREARAFRAAVVSPAQVREALGTRIRREQVVRWDERAQAVQALDEERIGALALRSQPLALADPQALAAAMLDGVRRMGLDALPWDEASRALVARVESLRHWQPEAGWPALDAETLAARLEDWLAPWLAGITRREQLAKVDLAAALRALVPGPMLARLDAGAPARLEVPDGSRVRLAYRPGEAPVLAVKLQQMFGACDTPAVCWGRVPVQIHLLSPAGRALHVTQDLASFWRNAYPEVRKEMRGRYPKHPWPQDPLAAAPSAHAKRRRR